MPTHYKDDLRKVSVWLGWLAGIQFVLLWVDVPAGWRGIAGYLPLHNLLETASIVVAGMVVAVGWSAIPSTTPVALVVLACAFSGVAALDFSHMLSYAGMPDFVTPSSPEKAINFWLAARLMATAALLWAVLAPWQKFATPATRYLTLGAVFLVTVAVHALVLFAPQGIPRTFIAGQGLTPFKVGAEYLIIFLNLCAAGLLLMRMRKTHAFNAPWLLGSVLTVAMSEIFFTLYANVTDVYNLAGHIYKVIAYLFLFRAVYVHAVRRPYIELAEVQNSLRATMAAIPDLVFEMGVDGTYYSYHSPPDSRLLAFPPNFLVGRKVAELMPAATAEVVLHVLREAHEKGHASGYLIALDLPVGKRWFELSASRKNMVEGEEHRIVVMSRDVTQRLQSEEQLRLLGLAMSNLSDIVLITEAEPVGQSGHPIVFVNDAFERRTGYSRAEVLGKSPRLLLGPRSSPDAISRIRKCMQEWQPAHEEVIYYTRNHEEFWVELDFVPLKDMSGKCTHWVAVLRDVTERVRAKEAMSAVVQHTQAILDNMADGVITAGADGTILSFSKAAGEIFGYRAEEVIGKDLTVLMPAPEASQHPGYMHRFTVTGEARLIGAPREVEGLRRDGQVFPMSLSVTKTEHQGRTTFIGLVRDITRRRKDEEEIRRLAFYDGLTGLPNRRLLIDHLHHAMLACGRSGYLGALMFMDLDHFKLVNDTLGHPVGDELLKQVAKRLQATMREGDTVSRMGGDEFVLVLENLSRLPDEAASSAESVASKVLYALSQPYNLAGRELVCTSSLGIVMFGQTPRSYDDLMKDADSALYQAKAAGRNTFCFFDPDMQAAAVARSRLEEDLRRGIDNQELVLFYQLQVQGKQARPTGVEALVRWKHPERGMVPPSEFIPLAEESGLMIPMGSWVMHTACRQLAEWAADPLTRNLSVAVNVSAQQFAQSGFVADVEMALQRTGARADLLKLELTESALVANLDDVILKINALRGHGVRFSLDDFGTGYSSLSYLKRLPLYQLKIDQSFVRDLLTDPNDAAIANTIVALGLSLGLHVIAEGVETEGQRDSLQQMGCNSFQGYLFGRPMEAGDLRNSLCDR